MSIVVRFNPVNVTRQKYDEVVRRLEQAGQWPDPPGLELHVLFGSEGDLRVSEICDSPESLEAYGEKVFPDHGGGWSRAHGRARDLRGTQLAKP